MHVSWAAAFRTIVERGVALHAQDTLLRVMSVCVPLGRARARGSGWGPPLTCPSRRRRCLPAAMQPALLLGSSGGQRSDDAALRGARAKLGQLAGRDGQPAN